MTADVNAVKALTRVSMGLCQGRNCQRQLAAAIARAHGGGVADVAPATPRVPVAAGCDRRRRRRVDRGRGVLHP